MDFGFGVVVVRHVVVVCCVFCGSAACVAAGMSMCEQSAKNKNSNVAVAGVTTQRSRNE